MVPSIVGTCQGMMQKTARECDTFKGERNADRQNTFAEVLGHPVPSIDILDSAPWWKMAHIAIGGTRPERSLDFDLIAIVRET